MYESIRCMYKIVHVCLLKLHNLRKMEIELIVNTLKFGDGAQIRRVSGSKGG
jgi:hypothetical protein